MLVVNQTTVMAPGESVPLTDYVLGRIVKVINEYQMEKPVTLLLSGLVVTGTLISCDRYYALLHDMLEASSDETGELARVLADIKPDVHAQPCYIHLMNAKKYIGGSLHAVPGSGLWRGRLSCIDGHEFGI